MLDPTSLALRKDSFVDGELREHFSDLLYQVDLKDGQGAYVYVLLEHKSHAEPLVAFQLLRYLVRIWEQSLREESKGHLAPIIPVVVYHGSATWRAGLNFGALFGGPEPLRAYWPEFRYQLCDLSAYSDEEIKGEIILRVGLLLLKYIFREDVEEHLPGILALIRELRDQATALEYLETVLRYVALGTDKVTKEGLQRAVEAAFAGRGGAAMGKTLAEQWIEEGMQRGIQQGMQQGMQRGIQQGMQRGIQQGMQQGLLADAREALVDILEARFEKVPRDMLEVIKQSKDVSILKRLRRKAVMVRSMQEFAQTIGGLS
ncbi:MAG: Rpn family recombination-promoting nuclease/putative transposase [Anaerolineae bacterium]|nr:Rpn family recombination-promoting nuclease/putative transposase [Anaerolineae bacterium]